VTRPQTTQLLEGKKSAAAIREEAAAMVQELRASGTVPGLALVLATADESAAWYTRAITRAGEKVGVDVRVERLADDASAADVGATLRRLSADAGVHGIILQTPLPADAVFEDLAASIDPAKDVDGVNPVSLGRLTAGLPAFASATAEAVLALLDHHAIPLAGAHTVVVGRSIVVGKPAAQLLLQRDATVTVCHRHTKELAEVTRSADVLVAAVGRPNLITAEFVAEDAVVIDVGTNPTPDGGLVGDVDADSVTGRAAGLTPVPGGVGPVTTALLLQHTVASASG
jgi:methylenetetrahydrofolate dehydrogenase (NADP+) / methenyltetrahydrofolate cyclohydrolase